jgi:hypothetical protein
MTMHALSRGFKHLAHWLRPLTLGFVVLGLCLYQGRMEKKYRHKDYREGFPFSHYPMYSSFTDFEYYVFVTDAQDQPLALETVTQGLKTSALKKQFDNRIDKVTDAKGKGVRNRDVTADMARPHGEALLADLRKKYPGLASQNTLKLYQVTLRIKDGQVDESAPIFIAQSLLSPRTS